MSSPNAQHGDETQNEESIIGPLGQEQQQQEPPPWAIPLFQAVDRLTQVVTQHMSQNQEHMLEEEQKRERKRTRERGKRPRTGSSKIPSVRKPYCIRCQKYHFGTCMGTSGTCHNCGHMGHKTWECRAKPWYQSRKPAMSHPTIPERSEDEQGRKTHYCKHCHMHHFGGCTVFHGICHMCKQVGHKARDCPAQPSRQEAQTSNVAESGSVIIASS